MRRLAHTLTAALALLAVAAPAQAASTVIGAGLARQCYLAAETGQTSMSALTVCNDALADVALTGPDRVATLVNRGVLHLLRRDGEDALADFDRALAEDAAVAEAHVNRGAALVLVGEHAEAVAAIDRGLELGASDPHEAYFNRAIAKERLDDLQGAYEDYKTAQTLAPNWPLPTAELARFTVAAR